MLEKESGLKWKQDFFVGYSLERINPGDREHTLTKILQVVSGETPQTLEKVAQLYEMIIVPGVHRASSTKAAEAAKAIENTQRDLNIALMNELAVIFGRIGNDTSEVLEAAGTKWNFLKFKPGLVGGHCIGVDPYSYGVEVFVTDPQAESAEVEHEYGVRLIDWSDLPRADAIVAAVSHREFASLSMEDLAKKLVQGGAFIDVKAAFDAQALHAAGYRLWRL